MNKDNVILIRENCTVEYGFSDAWLDRATVLYENGRYEEALQAYEKALELNPDDSYVWCEKGFTLFSLDRYEEALMVFDKILEPNPDDSDAWYGKGIALYGLGRYEEALQAYEKARELIPDLFQNWCDIAAALCKLGRFEEALQYYEKALELNPDDSEAFYGKGTALDNLKRYEEAQIAFKKASELNMVIKENFTMKNYSIEELQNLNAKELIEIGKSIVKGKLQFTDEKMQILYAQTILVGNRVKDINEVMTTPCICNPSNYAEIRETLEKAFEACDREDWTRCRSALEVFFEWEANQDLTTLDLYAWDYQHIIRWWVMLYETNICDEKPDGSPAQIFSDKINYQFFLRMPQHAKPKLEEGLKKFFPKAYNLLKNSTTYTEDGQKCLTITEAEEALGMPEGELSDALIDKEIGEYFLTEDQTYTLQ
jgi:pentatricopeptide repeat protein